MASFPSQLLLFDNAPAAGEAGGGMRDGSGPIVTVEAPEPPPVSPARPAPLPLEELHPALWRAHQLGQHRLGASASGFAELDLALPGHGWPHRALTELLLPQAGIGELRLLAPALSALQQQRPGQPVMLFDPPALPCAATCVALGLALPQLVIVKSRPPRPGIMAPHARLRQRLPAAADLLWTLEQTLASGHAGAVLAWLPPILGIDAMRRLQFAAQAHDGPAFVLRDTAARLKPSVAPLRIELMPAPPDGLGLRVLKRRGPPLLQPLRIELAPVLTAAARERARQASAAAARVATRHPA